MFHHSETFFHIPSSANYVQHYRPKPLDDLNESLIFFSPEAALRAGAIRSLARTRRQRDATTEVWTKITNVQTDSSPSRKLHTFANHRHPQFPLVLDFSI